jgi:hypothetical protein
MKNNIMNASIFLVIIGGILSRLLPHPPNFVPITAIALFAGSRFNKKTAFVIPFIIMFLTDLILGFHSTMLFIYGSFLLTTILGFNLKKFNLFSLGKYTLISSILFFVITNFGVWMFFDMYPKTLMGLANCYVMAIPFFKNSLLGDLFYSGVIFYGFKFVETKVLNINNSPARNLG